MAQNPIEDATKALKDALYVGVGLGVIAVQKVQVQRQELRKQLTERRGDTREQLTKVGSLVEARMKVVEDRLSDIESRVDAAIDQVEARLPDPVQDVSKQVRAAAKTARETARHQLEGLVSRPNGAS